MSGSKYSNVHGRHLKGTQVGFLEGEHNGCGGGGIWEAGTCTLPLVVSLRGLTSDGKWWPDASGGWPWALAKAVVRRLKVHKGERGRDSWKSLPRSSLGKRQQITELDSSPGKQKGDTAMELPRVTAQWLTALPPFPRTKSLVLSSRRDSSSPTNDWYWLSPLPEEWREGA